MRSKWKRAVGRSRHVEAAIWAWAVLPGPSTLAATAEAENPRGGRQAVALCGEAKQARRGVAFPDQLSAVACGGVGGAY